MEKGREAVVAILGILVVLLCPNRAEAQGVERGVDVSYDRFQDVTEVTYTTGLQPDQPFSIIIGGTCKGDSLCRSDTYKFGLMSFSDSWEYLDANRNLWFLLNDTTRLALGELDHNGNVRSSGSVTEVLSMEIPHAVLKQIGNANKVEMKVGLTESVLQPITVRGISEFIARVED